MRRPQPSLCGCAHGHHPKHRGPHRGQQTPVLPEYRTKGYICGGLQGCGEARVEVNKPVGLGIKMPISERIRQLNSTLNRTGDLSISKPRKQVKQSVALLHHFMVISIGLQITMHQQAAHLVDDFEKGIENIVLAFKQLQLIRNGGA